MWLKSTLLCYECYTLSHTHTIEKFTVQAYLPVTIKKNPKQPFFLLFKEEYIELSAQSGLFHHVWLPNFPTVIHPKKLLVKPFKTIYEYKHQAQLFVLAPLCTKPDWTRTRWGWPIALPCGATLEAAQQTRSTHSTIFCDGERFNIKTASHHIVPPPGFICVVDLDKDA